MLSSNVTRSGPGFISTTDPSLSKLLLSSPHGPFLMLVEEERGSGQLHRECGDTDGSIDTKRRNRATSVGRISWYYYYCPFLPASSWYVGRTLRHVGSRLFLLLLPLYGRPHCTRPLKSLAKYKSSLIVMSRQM